MNMIEWAKAQRKLNEMLAQELAKDADNKTIVEIAVMFPYYQQDEVHKVGDIRRDPATDQPKRCVVEYDGNVQRAWTINDGTLWYAYHGISKDTAYPYVAPSGAHDQYLKGEYMTFTDGLIYEAVNNTVYSPETNPSDWMLVE